MKYPDEHWVKVAKYYKEFATTTSPSELIGGKTNETVVIEKIQNHYPHVTKDTVAKWVRTCKKDGYL